MKSPQDMRIIQIDITNACIHRCSNCTRFCGHHKKPFFMDWETFKKAVDSFEGYHGTVGIMGGEPTLHPEFERFVRYIKEHPYYPKTENLLVSPAKNFMTMIAKMEQRDTYINKEHGIERRCVHGFGLWSALSEKYRDYYELIQDTFNFQAVNDHTAIMYHSPILVRRLDIGMSDEDWIETRDNCWAQKEWSATITPKGAFFCEIAGALDMLFDGPGGWPIEPGWWKRKPEEFGDQLKWCELCGIAFSSFTRDANEEVDDMSPWYFDTLTKMGSPKVREGLANVLDIDESGTISELSRQGSKQVRRHEYSDSYFARFNNDWLNPKGFVGLIIADERDRIDEYRLCANQNRSYLDNIHIVTTDEDIYEELKEMNDGNIMVDHSGFTTWGSCVNKAITKTPKGYFIVILDVHGTVSENAYSFLKGYVLNPGSIIVKNSEYDMQSILGNAISVIFSSDAYALKKATWPMIRDTGSIDEFLVLWDDDKIIPLKENSFIDYEYRIEKDKKYALYGIGARAEEMYCLFDETQIVAVADSDSNRWGENFHGHRIMSPDELYNYRESFDRIFVTSRFFFEIKTMLIEKGFNWQDIVTTLLVL